MKIAIHGGTGYLGRHLTRYLVSIGHNIVWIQRKTPASTEAGVANVYLLDELSSLSADETCKIDLIVNCSCKYQLSNVSEYEIFEANLTNPAKVLCWAMKNKINKFITIGTGLPPEHNTYAFTKKLFADLGKYYTVKFQNLIFYNLLLENYYGFGEPEHRFIPSTLQKMLRNEKIMLTAGTQRRDFIHINDVVNIISHLLLSKIQCASYQDFPVGTGAAPQIKELIEFIKEETHSNSELLFGYIKHRQQEPDSVADKEIMDKFNIKANIDWKTGFRALIKEYTK